MRFSMTLLSVIALTALTGCQSAQVQGTEDKGNEIKSLSGAEITQIFSGKTVKWYWEDETGTQTYNADGTASATRSKSRTKTGSWWVENDRSCRTWKDYNVGKTTCYQIVQVGENRFDLYLDGKPYYSEEIIK